MSADFVFEKKLEGGGREMKKFAGKSSKCEDEFVGKSYPRKPSYHVPMHPKSRLSRETRVMVI